MTQEELIRFELVLREADRIAALVAEDEALDAAESASTLGVASRPYGDSPSEIPLALAA